MLENLHYFILLALFAEVAGTIGGFGSSLFFVPIASYFLDFHSVLGITALFHVSSNVSKIILFRKGFNRHLLIYIGTPAIIFVLIGAWLSKYVETKLLETILAFFLIIISVVLLILKNFKIKPNVFNTVGGGVLSGFLAGLLGTGGAVRGVVLAAFNLKIEVFIATSAIIDLLIDSSRSIVYYMNGFVHKHDLYLVPILFIISIIGTYIGKRILMHVSEEKFKSLVLVLILVTGLITLLK